ncbi:MAG: FkbM family methyltransferase [Gemmatimonadetes bacterium]|nr:FkbM family methyltransferase [Gemmatimonadota bacterium]
MDQPGVLRRVSRYGYAAMAGFAQRSWPATLVTRQLPPGLRCRVVGAIGSSPLPRRETVEDCWGIRAKLFLDDDVQRRIFFGLFERKEIALVKSLVGRGDVCLDVGANVGFYACHLGRLVGSSGTVFAFEPEPRNAVRLETNLELSGVADRVSVELVAVSDQVGWTRFHRSPVEHSGWGSIHDSPGFRGDTVQVRTTTIDAFMKDRSIHSARLLKVDVEGGDPEVYAGATESLARGAFRFILAEWNGVRFPQRGISLDTFLDGFDRFGYRPIRWRGSAAEALLGARVDPEGAIVNFVLARN